MNVLLAVANPTALAVDDTLIHDRLVAQGHTVTYIDDGAAPNLTGIGLVVFSTGVIASATATKYDGATCGVLSLTAAARPHSTYANGTPGGSANTTSQSLTLVPGSDPLSGGLSGTTQVLTAAPAAAWSYYPAANLGAGAVNVWTYLDTQLTRSVGSRVESGGQMFTGTAPSRRALLHFANIGGLSNLNTAGLAVLDAAIAWTSVPPPAANAGPDITVTATGTPTSSTFDVALTGSGTDPGGQALTYAWSIVSGSGTLLNATTATPTLRVSKYGATVTVRLVVTNADGVPSAADTAVVTVAPVANVQVLTGGTLVPAQLFTGAELKAL